jgi:tetratricopeptide (TPR) repeat protein
MTKATNNAFERAVADAVAHQRAGRLRAAEAAYREALSVSPDHPVATHNLGVVTAAQGDHLGAIGHFDRAIAAEPRYASAHYNRAIALAALGQVGQAIESFSRACAIEPEHYDAHRALGFLWLAEGERGRSLDHFARTYELRRGDDQTGIAARSLTEATRTKLRHDAEQFRYLAARRHDRKHFEVLARTYDDVARDAPQEPAPLSEQQREMLGDGYNTAIHVASAPELADGALSERTDRAYLVRRFRSEQTGAIYVDDLLTPRALALLQQFLLESTIWHDFSHIGGFVAAYLEDGLACPLLLQIADELRKALPELLGGYPLTQAWAFKAVDPSAAVDVHADDAAITVNFWVTPTEANLEPGRGGLAVCRVPPPGDWELEGYDADQERIVTFLGQNVGDTLIVPYRQNRAVLFESRLFHSSDMPKFVEMYEYHRVSVTLLYGRRGARASMA